MTKRNIARKEAAIRKRAQRQGLSIESEIMCSYSDSRGELSYDYTATKKNWRGKKETYQVDGVVGDRGIKRQTKQKIN